MAKKRAGEKGSIKISLKKYIFIAIVLGLVEGGVTYLFLNDVGCSNALNAIGDPLSLIPYIAIMVFIAIVALSLLIRGDRVSGSLFLFFMLAWLLVGFGVYYTIGPAIAC